jgi:ketosteroid isomerase-like protein
MKTVLAAGALVLFCAGVAGAQPPAAAKAGAGVAQALIQMENQWAQASKNGDADALAPLLSEDFIALDSDGSLRGKTEVLARVKKAKWTTNEISDMKVTVHGDSAIVTGSWVGKGTDGAGKAIDARERWADTWVKAAGGKWQCVASASAPMK